ncbi:hypothetical protein Hanom_Chr11g01057571 [Helianthus anomalus]
MPLDPPVMNTWRDFIGIFVGCGRVMSFRNIKRRMMSEGSKRSERSVPDIFSGDRRRE